VVPDSRDPAHFVRLPAWPPPPQEPEWLFEADARVPSRIRTAGRPGEAPAAGIPSIPAGCGSL